MLLQDLLKEFLFHVQIKGHTPRTLKSRKTNITAFFKYLENEFEVTELEEIKPLHIKQYGMFLLKKGRKETYINSIYKSVRGLFNYCIDEGYILQKHNPCLSVKWMKEETPVIKAFTSQEIRNMVNAYKMTTFIEARNKLIIMLLADTGIRNLELCHLLQSNVGETTIKIMGFDEFRDKTYELTETVSDKMLEGFKDMYIKELNEALNGEVTPIAVEVKDDFGQLEYHLRIHDTIIILHKRGRRIDHSGSDTPFHIKNIINEIVMRG
ncbi:phage integrase SAM-like domain-containing protein [Bacillus rhizoplanae]|uniref:phage integrase SAM-like domain-containing protein n=1 Tax=Bacillus rhizoplanae TaxID=2880966 RepID=UPI003D1E5AA6